MSGNPIAKVKSLSEATFVDQVRGDIYAYENKLFILLGNVDNEIVKDLQRFLNDKSQILIQVSFPYLTYRIPTKFPFMYIECRIDHYFYQNIPKETIPYRKVPSL